jgi:hypothetical protein
MKFKQNTALFLIALTVLLSIPSSAFAAEPEPSGVDSLSSDPVFFILVALFVVSMVINVCLLIWALRMRRQIRHNAHDFYNRLAYNEDAIHNYAKMETLIEFGTEVFAREQAAEPEVGPSAQELEAEPEVDFSIQRAEAEPEAGLSTQEVEKGPSQVPVWQAPVSEAGLSTQEVEEEPDTDFSVQKLEAESEESALEMIRQVLVDLQQVQETNDEPVAASEIDEPVASSEFEIPGAMASEPVASERPLVTEPAISEPTITEPAISELAMTEPAMTGPVMTEPAIMKPAMTEFPTPEAIASEAMTPVPESVSLTSIPSTPVPPVLVNPDFKGESANPDYRGRHYAEHD